MISDTLSALMNIVNVGEMESEDYNQVNKNALAFDLEGAVFCSSAVVDQTLING